MIPILSGAGSFAGVLNNPNVLKWVIRIIIILLIVYVLRRNWWYIKNLFKRSDVRLEPGEKLFISDDRKSELESLALAINQDLKSTSWYHITGHDHSLWTSITGQTSDNELKYLARYYKKYVSGGSSLYKDIDNKWMYSTDIDEKLMARLSKIGEVI